MLPPPPTTSSSLPTSGRPLTPAALRSAALAAGGYATPSLNDVLVVSNRGFTEWVEAGGDDANNPPSPLAPYAPSLRALHADGNGFTLLPSSLITFPRLACLFLQCNGLASLEGLDGLAPALVTLDVSSNALTSLAGLPPTLETLRATANPSLGAGGDDAVALAGLTACPSLATLDLAHCGLSDANTLLSLLTHLPSLRCLYVTGNAASSTLPRRTLVAACPGLTYLNDSLVFGGERAAADAWRQGGDDAATAAATAWSEAERKRVALVEDGLRAVVEDKENFARERGGAAAGE